MGWERVGTETGEEDQVEAGRGDRVRGVDAGETAGIEGHLREYMRTYCSGKFLKYIKVILMKSPN